MDRAVRFYAVSYHFDDIPSLIVEQMLVTCNETIQNVQEAKSDFLLVVDYRDIQTLKGFLLRLTAPTYQLVKP